MACKFRYSYRTNYLSKGQTDERYRSHASLRDYDRGLQQHRLRERLEISESPRYSRYCTPASYHYGPDYYNMYDPYIDYSDYNSYEKYGPYSEYDSYCALRAYDNKTPPRRRDDFDHTPSVQVCNVSSHEGRGLAEKELIDSQQCETLLKICRQIEELTDRLVRIEAVRSKNNFRSKHVDSTNMSKLSIDSLVDGTSDTLGDLQNHVLEKKRSSLEVKNVSVMTFDLVAVASSYSLKKENGLLPELQEVSFVETLEASTCDTYLVSNKTTPSALIDISTLSYSTCYSNPLFEMHVSELEVKEASIVGPSLSESKSSDNHQEKPLSEVEKGLVSAHLGVTQYEELIFFQLSVTRYVLGPTPYKSMLLHSELIIEFVLSSLKKEAYPYWRLYFEINSLEAASVVCLGDLSDDDFFDF
ncbi:hypothetical protein AXF42_Ash011591 [Apostasia shenzhenica]|uniref:Uncharacterized protein n=1 Tax=Apostasia shenzhenica TaxID=1088818 RepID=A0A2I0BB48_9ASPA|nr:hypothetical protein AXF42_Ash011591 [Apostasia shenzhenica]